MKLMLSFSHGWATLTLRSPGDSTAAAKQLVRGTATGSNESELLQVVAECHLIEGRG